MNIYTILCCLVLVATGTNRVAFAMDTPAVPGPALEMMGLPTELWDHIVQSSHADNLTQEAFVARLFKLRGVCTQWRAILTDNYIADLIDLRIKAESYEELEECLAQAVEDENVAKIAMICKLYPQVPKGKALVEASKLMTKGMSVKYVKLLLDLGCSPNAIIEDDDDCFDGTFLGYVLYQSKYSHRHMGCLDLLLAGYIDTREKGLLLRAATKDHIYAMYKLLTCPLDPNTNYTRVLEAWCCNCYDDDEKLMDVFAALIARGAKVPTAKISILQQPVTHRVLSLVRVLLEHGAMLVNIKWLITTILERHYDDRVQAQLLIPEIIVLALDKGQDTSSSFAWFSPNAVLEQLLKRRDDGTYYFSGAHFYPCIKKLMTIGLKCQRDLKDECVSLLLDQADPQIIDLFFELKFPIHTWKYKKLNKTALHILVCKNNMEAIRKLLAGWTGDIDIPDVNGKTPLECALRMGVFDTASVLIEFGAADIRNTKLYDAGDWNTDEQVIGDLCNGDSALPVQRTIDTQRVQAQSEPVTTQFARPNIMPAPQPLPQPEGSGTKAEHVHKIGGPSYTLLAGLSLAAIASYGFYRYWYSDTAKDDAQEVDADDGVQLQEI